MATKKTAVKAVTQPKGKPSTSMIPWEEQMARDADIAAAKTGSGGGGSFISFKGGAISVEKTPIPGNKLETVVLTHIFENALYDGIYDPENPQPPSCFAFGDIDSEEANTDMVPHEKAGNPQGHPDPKDAGKPGASCHGCWANQWASADQGRGKACKNVRRLALIAGDEESIKDAESIAAQKVHYAKTPVTSSKYWDAHVKDVSKTLRRPPLGVVTEITTAPDPKTQFRLVISTLRPIETGEQYEALAKMAKRQEEDIRFPYQPMSEDREPTPARGNKSQKFRSAPPVKAAAKKGFGVRR